MSNPQPQRLLITGSSGMAESAARLASSRGAQLFIVGNNQQECEALTAFLPHSAHAIADVMVGPQVEAAVARAFAVMGGVDAVFCWLHSIPAPVSLLCRHPVQSYAVTHAATIGRQISSTP